MMISTYPLRRVAALPCLLCLTFLSSCQTPPKPAASASPASQEAMAPNKVQDDAAAAPARPESSGPLVRQVGTENTPTLPARPQRYEIGQDGDISLNYVDADIHEVARLILGEILKRNYSVDPGIQGVVTIQTAHPLKRDELIPTLQGLLGQVGAQITYQNGIYRISQQGNDAEIPPMVGYSSMEAGSQVVLLRYASAKQLAAMLQPYVGDGVRLIADPSRNILIVSGTATARQNVVDLIRVFDVDYLAGQSYALYPAKSGDPSKMAADLQAALQLGGDGALAGAVKIVPIEEASAVMVITRQPAYLDRVGELIEQLDKVRLSAGRHVHVYYLKNTQPKNLQPILQRAFNPPSGGGGNEEAAPGNLPPTATAAQIGAPAANTGAPTNGAASALPVAQESQIGASNAAATAASQPPAPDTEANQQVAGGNAKGPQIIADTANSALIVVATESEYAQIEEAIRKLDILPMQVLVEATIAEVSLNKNLQYGVQFFLNNKEGQITLSNAQSGVPTVIDPANPLTNAQLFPGTLAPNFPGFAVARTAGSVQAALQALKNITNVQIISAPELLIMDKQEATFQVGDLVPTITQSAISVTTAGAPVVNNVQYQATGVILNVTPRINSGGLVTLDIEQQVSDVVPTTSSSINSPTFQQRRVKTKVVVQDGETISLAGLISDNNTRGNSGIPLLQDIPVFGSLFSTKTNSHNRTELLVLLTPHVVHDQREARALTEELRRKLTPSGIVP